MTDPATSNAKQTPSRSTTTEDLDRYAVQSGLGFVARYCDWQGSPFRVDAAMQIRTYRRPEG
jgi:hypothetical protein